MLDLNDSEAGLELPDRWQIKDPRLQDLLDISYAIIDIFDSVYSPFSVDRLELDFLPLPLELAETMKKMAGRIEQLTEKRE